MGEAIQNVLSYLKKRGEGLAAKASTPISSGFRSKIDITPKLGEEAAASPLARNLGASLCTPGGGLRPWVAMFPFFPYP